MKFNKGEWSELYVLTKLLADKELSPADESLEKVLDIVYPILRIIREHGNKPNQHFKFTDQDIVILDDTKEVSRIPQTKFKEFSNDLLTAIRETKGASFQVEGAEGLLKEMQTPSVKASSNNKTDINIVIHDHRTGLTPNLGFSIKSQLGSPSTLLNPGKTTNFLYEITNISHLNNIEKNTNNIFLERGGKQHVDVRGRVKNLKDKGAKFKFVKTDNICFSNNLRLIDSLLPEILAEMLFTYFADATPNISELLLEIKKANFLNFDDTQEHNFYEYKVKRFLTDVAIGMTPSAVWNGQADANGGYIIIRKDGEIVCYHLYDRNLFENYLVANTKLETPSTSRYEFGELYKEGNKFYLKLCMQIRFKK